MRKPSASLAGFIVLAVLVCREPAFGQCVVFEDPADMFRVADAVFIGTVRKTEPAGDVGFHIVMHRASFEIDAVWKGDVKTLETVGTVEAFQPGKRYLVFAGAPPGMSRSEEGRLRTSLECGWAEIEDEKGPKLRWLRERIGKPRPAREIMFANHLVLFLQDERYQGALMHPGVIIPVQHRERCSTWLKRRSSPRSGCWPS